MPPTSYRIRDAQVDVRPDLGCLLRADATELRLRPKTFETLLLLLEQRHRVVSKEEIARHVWPDTAVTDDALVQCVVEIRRALGDDAKQARFIATLPKRGYRFLGEVDVDAPLSEPTIDQAEQRPDSPAPERRHPIRWMLIAAVLVSMVAAAGYFTSLTSAKKAGLVAAWTSSEPRRPRVAVMFLENESRSPDLDWLREGLVDMLVTGLSRSTAITVISRQQLEVLLDRTGHAGETSIGLADAIEVCRRAGVDQVVLGGFAKLGNTIRIDLRLHDQSGRLQTTEALTIETPDELLTQVDLLSWRLARHFGELSSSAVPPATMLTRNLEAYRYYSLGVTQANHYHNVEAIALLTKAIELDPEFAMAYGRIGYAYGVTWSQIDRAKPYLAKAYQLSQRLSDRDRLFVEAWNALVHFDYTSSATMYAEIIRRYPTEIEPYVRLGTILSGDRKYDEAIRVFQRGLAVDPESTDLWNRLGGVYGEAGRSSEDIAARQKYVALRPKEANAYDSLGSSYQAASRYSDAIAAYQQALDLDRAFDVAWVHLGNAYIQTGQYARAEAAYRNYLKAASSDDERRRAYLTLGVLAERRGNIGDAAALVARARPVKPFGLDVPIRLSAGESASAVAASLIHPVDTPNRGSRFGDRALEYALGLVSLKQGDTERGLAHLQAAVRDRPLMWHADWLEDVLANAYLQLGRYDEAITEYQRILRKFPRYPLAHYRLGLALEGKGEPLRARQAYEQFLGVWADADADVKEIVSARAKLAALTH